MAITLSESAAKHVSNFIAKRGKGLGIRLGVKTSGCSGMAYKLEFVDVATDDDITFQSHGVGRLERRLQVQQPEREG